MSGVTVTGVLPVGIEYQGELHREFEVRPQKGRDVVDAIDTLPADKAQSKPYLGLAIQARQIVRLGTIPAAAITADLLGDAWTADLGALDAALEEAEKKLHGAKPRSGTGAPSSS